MFLGMEDEGAKFKENLHGAERYVKWGIERNSKRDLEKAIELLESCEDENAGKPADIFNKYRLLCDSRIKTIETDLDIFIAESERINKIASESNDSKDNIATKISELEENLKELEADGQGISAKKVSDEIEGLKRIMGDSSATSEEIDEIDEAYLNFLGLYQNHLKQLEMSTMTIRSVEAQLPEDIKLLAEVLAYVTKSIGEIKALAEKANPENAKTSQKEIEEDVPEEAKEE